MRKSTSRKRSRLLCAGLTTGAVVTALLVAPQAAFAVGVSTPFTVVPGGTAAVVDPTPTTAFTAASVVQLSTAACAATFTTPTAAIVNASSAPTNTGGTRIGFTVPGNTATNLNGTAKVYNACVYAGAVAGTSVLQSSSAVGVGTPPALNQTTGVSGGGNQLTFTAPNNAAIFTGLTTLGAIFTTGNCAATYGTPTANLATEVTRASNTVANLTVPAGVTTATAAPTAYQICLYNGQTSTSALISSTPYNASILTLSNASGPTGGTNGITANTTSPLLAGISAPGILFTSGATCPTLYDTATVGGVTPLAVSADNIRVLADNRVALTVPNVTAGTSQVCVYGGDAVGVSTLLATTSYVAAVAAAATSITPNAGPATGGTPITVIGTNFPTTPGSITASLGGVPLINVTPLSSVAFTAITPRHSVENNSTLIVTTATGTRALQNAFTFQNAITVKPNTAPNTRTAIDVEVTGTGFLSNTFSGGSATRARVFLVEGAYNATDLGSGVRANGPVAECTNVLAISDEQLICTLRLDKRLNPAGTAFFSSITYQNLSNATAAPTVTTVAGSRIVTVAAGTFSLNDLGQPITVPSNTEIPAGAIITSVLSPTKVAISANALTTQATPVVATIGTAAVRTQTGVTTTTAAATSRTITATAGSFTSADIGRVVGAATGTVGGVASTAVATSGTTIIAVSPNGDSATLSAPAIAIAADGSFPLWAAAPVPVGAYTLTVVSNGAPDAEATDPSYMQSAVTSGATFTVASS